MDRFRKRFSGFSSLIVIAFVLIIILLIKDTGKAAAVRYLAAVFAVSFFMRPFFVQKHMKYPDEGFGLCFGLGLALCFFVCWTFCAITSFEFADAAVFGTFVIMAVSGMAVNRLTDKGPYITSEELRRFTGGFAVFAVIFLVFYYIIGFNPLVDPGTENYMDFGFMQTMYRQRSAIIYDIWFSNTKLNYYYLGQAAAVYLTRLAVTTPEYGYNLMLCTFVSSVFAMVFELVAGIANELLPDFKQKRLSLVWGGILGGSAAAFCANPHWILYGPVLSAAKKILGTDDGEHYWFPDGTVYINTQYNDPDNGKNEFPAYSVILGDLHAHVVNLIFVLPLIALLFEYALGKDEKETNRSRIYTLLVISVLLGMFKGSNYWDFAIYYVITGAVIVFTDVKKRGSSLNTMGKIAIKAFTVTIISIIAILPFTLNFSKMESGIQICTTHSPVMKMAVLWLPGVLTSLMLIFLLYFSRDSERFSANVARPALLAFVLCTLGLVITPEVVYVEDIYGGDNKRFNTMFKLTYQAYVLFAVIFGITVSVLLFRMFCGIASLYVMRICIGAAAIYCVLSVMYTPYAVYQRYGKVWKAGLRSGISSLEGLRSDGSYGFEMEAYDYLMGDESKVINIVEAAGNSYTHESALSVYTGACTPIGWYVHEWMWHNDSQPVQERADLVAYFYRSGNEEFCREFLKTYDIDYIFVGPAEVCKYPVNRNGFWNLGEICVETIWQDCELALIKVDRSRL